MDIFGELFAGLAGDEYTPAQLRAMREMEDAASRISGVPSHMLGNIAQDQAARERRQAPTNHLPDAPTPRLPPQDGGTIDIPYEDVT